MEEVTESDTIGPQAETNLVPVTTVVPARYALLFQAQAQALLASILDTEYQIGHAEGFRILDPPAAMARFPDAFGAPPWRPGDEGRCRWVFDNCTEAQRNVVLALAAGSDPLSADELAFAAGYDNGRASLPPALKHLAVWCRRVERRPLWDVGSLGYVLNAEARPLVQRAIVTNLALDETGGS